MPGNPNDDTGGGGSGGGIPAAGLPVGSQVTRIRARFPKVASMTIQLSLTLKPAVSGTGDIYFHSLDIEGFPVGR